MSIILLLIILFVYIPRNNNNYYNTHVVYSLLLSNCLLTALSLASRKYDSFGTVSSSLPICKLRSTNKEYNYMTLL